MKMLLSMGFIEEASKHQEIDVDLEANTEERICI